MKTEVVITLKLEYADWFLGPEEGMTVEELWRYLVEAEGLMSTMSEADRIDVVEQSVRFVPEQAEA